MKSLYHLNTSDFLLTIVLATIFATPANNKKIVWAAVGDSITYLNEHTDETGNRVTKGYMTMVVEEAPHVSYINNGLNGWTSRGFAQNIDSVGLVKADVYSIFLGTNDWWSGIPLGTFKDYVNDKGDSTVYGSFRIITSKIRELNPAAKLIFITPLQRTDFVYMGDFRNNAYGSYRKKNGQSLEQIANAILAIAKHERSEVIDLYHDKSFTLDRLVKFKRLKDPATGNYRNYKYPDYIDIPFNPETDEYPYPPEAIDMTYDGLHPSDAGNKIIAAKLLKLLKD